MARRAVSAGPGVDPYLPDRGDDGYRVVRYELELDYAVGPNHLDGRARIELVAARRLDRVVLDLEHLRVTKVAVNGSAARWQQRGGKVHVLPAAAIDEGAAAVVDVRYDGNPRPTESPCGRVGWEELSDGVLVAAQPSGACTWFPCNDLAWQKAPFRVSVTTASSYRVLVNGTLVGQVARGSTTTWSYEQDEPTSPYLMAVHIGRYDEHEIASAPVPIKAVLASQQRADFDRAFVRQPEMMALFVEQFGPYPFDAGYTVVVCPEVLEIPLEAQGQAVFGVNHLDGGHERLIAHELAHQWFGNSLTAAAWRDVWLHEGFACYAEWLWSEASGGLSAAAHARSHHRRLGDLDEDLLLADPGSADMFDDRVYKRGALTLHELRGALGDESFFALLREWTATYRHGIVTTEAFETMAATAAGPAERAVRSLFDRWLRHRALPDLTAG